MGEAEAERTGVLLLQLGTPDAPTPRAVRRYLREFLGDPRVLDMPALGRWLLLHAVILPFRPRRAAAAYRQIWTEAGSPLLVHGRALEEAVRRELGADFCVALAMRYGHPSIAEALERLLAEGVERVVAVPLFPQEAGSSSGSALERTLTLVGRRWQVPALTTLGPFPEDPGFIEATAEIARPILRAQRPDHVLFSYHGLPERQIRRGDPSGAHCLTRPDCCDRPDAAATRHCYRAQCFATSRALRTALGLPAERSSTCFQSRLGRIPWIRPFTDERLPELRAEGVRRLVVLCPSFVADCLETLEEIGLRAARQWSELGGESLTRVPCVNASPRFAQALARRVRASLPAGPPRGAEDDEGSAG